MTTTTTSSSSSSSTPAIYGWAILEMHHSQLRTMVRGMAPTQAEAWREAFGPDCKGRPKRSWARAEALTAEEWDYWQQYY
jgi:hypothetical protein